MIFHPYLNKWTHASLIETCALIFVHCAEPMNDTSVFLLAHLLIAPLTELDFFHFAQQHFAVGVVVCIPVFQVLPIGHHADVHASWAVLLGPLRHGWEPLALDVGLYPKVGEEEEEEDAVYPNEVDPEGNLVVTLLHEVVLADVNGDYNKLRLTWEQSDSMLEKYRWKKKGLS